MTLLTTAAGAAYKVSSIEERVEANTKVLEASIKNAEKNVLETREKIEEVEDVFGDKFEIMVRIEERLIALQRERERERRGGSGPHPVPYAR